jgi:hypothetical protein
MAHPLVNLNEQKLFDKAYKGIKSQGFEKSGGKDSCLYTSEKNGRTYHCAIGWICEGSQMPAECVSPKDSTFWTSLELDITLIPESRRDFLYKLQSIHDHAENPDDMQKRAIKFAEKHGLTIPPSQRELDPHCPLPPEVRVSFLQDPIHKEVGRSRPAKTSRRKKQN